MTTKTLISAAAGIVLAAAAGSVMAQERAPAAPVTPDRAGQAQADYEPAGVRAGSFLLFPKLELGETYNSNIYATKDNAKSDFILGVSPEVRARSNWANHALNFGAGLDYFRYTTHDSEDRVDYWFEGDGRFDVTRDTKLMAAGGYKLLHEDRSSSDSSGGKDPTEYSLTTGSLGGSHKFNRVSVGLDGGVKKYDFDNGSTDTASINNDDRDRTEWTEVARLGYEVKPGYEAFVKGGLNQRNYRLGRDDNGFNRDSKGYEVDTGLRLELSRLLIGDVFIGYMSQSYDDAALKDASGVGGGLALTWYATPLTTVRPSVSRTVEETTKANASSYISTVTGVDVSHELRRNVILNGNVSYTYNDFKGIDRTEDIITAGGGVKYLLNRNFYTDASYTYTDKDVSTSTNEDFSQHKVMLRVGGQL